ncbi:nucleic acid binding OB-fold tRNA/helicase-type [Segniliparus rotundus DSM 44985]|uniref:Nucleic acid binding OB-fold tRNA/helicase-type n=1 Tax=Segniliparus rotundus (strain ATCC BAA-972 / CDC 1076 / CIP 108378 / DSM 44985 / JCM 13578) TaxID=640132 RepID=D6ZER9_SEGRD|nr:OB-fold nucleic acid binding domain-containing protein [Segniliparus rotundus]ADG97443.1 nucleic acid binding OB-fold tRNA/helicase-type [Segniliparus rotundus DSM 44985]
MPSATQYFKQLARKLTADPSELDDEEIREEARALGAARACECGPGEIVVLVGELRSVSTCPKSLNVGVHAELFDGTDTVSLVWIGRTRIPGLEVGRSISVKGRLGLKEDGSKVMYNPYYELLEES